MIDSFGRELSYLRVSITDRCNLRCKYCMPEELLFIPHEEILSYGEILRVCALAAGLGISSFRVTGGEPLVREGCAGFIGDLKRLPFVKRVALTTNGILLGENINGLAAAGLDAVNISLDTLNPAGYSQLTGQDAFTAVWGSVLQAMDAGLKVKINCVVLRGINDGECFSFAALAEQYPLDVRFIEAMPVGLARGFAPVFGSELLAQLKQRYPGLAGDISAKGPGPARYYTCGGFKGRIGFIDALSHGFCVECNRLRLSCAGFLKLCLHHKAGVDLKALLRGGADDTELREAIKAAVARKPERHYLTEESNMARLDEMSRIGG